MTCRLVVRRFIFGHVWVATFEMSRDAIGPLEIIPGAPRSEPESALESAYIHDEEPWIDVVANAIADHNLVCKSGHVWSGRGFRTLPPL